MHHIPCTDMHEQTHTYIQVVPDGVWHLNTDPPPDQVVSFDASGDERWWDQTELVKLVLATNRLRELSEDIRLLSALTVLDVRYLYVDQTCAHVV